MSAGKSIFLGMLLGVAGVAFLTFAYFRFGPVPVSTDAAPIPFERYLAHNALHRRTHKAAAETSPFDATENNLMTGARIYRTACESCHSLPGAEKTCYQKGMYPPPPSLLNGKGVTDDPVGETHWVVQNGIRLTGMPSFRGTLSEDGIWQVSLLLAKANELPPAVRDYLAMPEADDCPPTSASQARR
jgi:thiosulfate dehydrogenase